MIVVSTKDFRANQTKFLNMANNGEDIILKSGTYGNFRIMPLAEDDAIATKRNLESELKESLQEVKEHLEGKRELKSLDNLICEL